MTTDSGTTTNRSSGINTTTTTNPSSEINTTTGGIIIYSAGGIKMSAATNSIAGSSTSTSQPPGDIHIHGAGYINIVTGSGSSGAPDSPSPEDIILNAQGNVNIYGQHFNNNAGGNVSITVGGNYVTGILGSQETFLIGGQANVIGGSQANAVGGDQTNVVLGAQENITLIDLLCLVLGAQQSVNIGPVKNIAPYVIDQNAVKIEQLEARMWDTNFSVKNILAELENTENKLDQTVSRLEQAETRLTQAETNIIT